MAASRQHKKATFLANISTIWAFERNQPRKKSRVIIMPPASLSPLSLPARKKSRFGGRGKMSSISVVHTLGDLSLTHSDQSDRRRRINSGAKRERERERGGIEGQTGKQRARISRAEAEGDSPPLLVGSQASFPCLLCPHKCIKLFVLQDQDVCKLHD